MTAALRQVAPAATSQGWEGFEAGDKVTTKAGTTGTLHFDDTRTVAYVTPDKLAGGIANPDAGKITAKAKGTFSVRAADVSEAARQLDRRGGRPPGSLSSPLARWLRIEIKQAKRDNWTCRDAFQMLVENNRKSKGDAFIVGAETASEVINAVHGDIKGRRVGFEYFRKLWREA